MQIQRSVLNTLVQNLPDGSKVVVDQGSDKVYALNATAGAAWEACTSPTTLSQVTKEMRHSFDPEVSEDLAEEAVMQLEKQGLVSTSESSAGPSRRKLIFALGAVALPMVISLTVGQQRAYAEHARSGQTTDPPRKHKGWWW
ncbi:MAG TPA: PqqD family protein [Terracidiphilus sp.]|nr:PqqD family protein [Terracidiphilus sp.]